MPETPSQGTPEAAGRSAGIPPSPRTGPRRQRMLSIALVAEVAALAAFLGFGMLGVAPYSPYLPHLTSTTSGNAVSFSSARSVAEAASTGYDNTSWAPVMATGISMPSPLPLAGLWGMNGSTGAPPVDGCAIVPATSGAAAFTIPASSSPAGSGLAPAWFFEFRDATGGTLLVLVLGGHASLYAVTSGPSCPSYYPTALNLSSGVIDSPQAASVVNAWGGGTFLGNYSGSAAIYSIVAASPYYFVPCVDGCGYAGGGAVYPPVVPANNGTGTGGGSVPPPVNCTACVPPPYALTPQYMPPTWGISYGPSLGGAYPAPTPAAFLSAEVDARNATLISLNIVTATDFPYLGVGAYSTAGCCPPSGPLGPPSPTSNGAATRTSPPGAASGSTAPPAGPSPGGYPAAGAHPSADRGGSGPIALGPVTGPLIVIGVLVGLGAAIALTWRARARPPTPPLRPSSGARGPTRPLDDVM